MTNIDQFESVFKAADKPVFHHQPVDVERILIVTDSDDRAHDLLKERASILLRALLRQTEPEWSMAGANDYDSVADLLGRIETFQPSVILTYRNLHIRSAEHPYSLGTYVDVMTQVSNVPVILFPRDIINPEASGNWHDTNSVMAITDHLSGEDRLVSYAAQLTEPEGKLYLTHVEDRAIFERYIETIGKIPSIDTDAAREKILDQLLEDPADYIASCSTILADHALPLEVVPLITLGHVMSDHRRLIDEHDVDILVMNTKDDDQLAMHGLAYPLSVELRDTPLMLL